MGLHSSSNVFVVCFIYTHNESLLTFTVLHSWHIQPSISSRPGSLFQHSSGSTGQTRPGWDIKQHRKQLTMVVSNFKVELCLPECQGPLMISQMPYCLFIQTSLMIFSLHLDYISVVQMVFRLIVSLMPQSVQTSVQLCIKDHWLVSPWMENFPNIWVI